MKKHLLVLFAPCLAALLLSAFPLAASGRSVAGLIPIELGAPEAAEGSVAGLLEKASPAPGRQPTNIRTEGPTESVILPGAANAAGKFGSYFTTDLFLVNPHPDGSLRINVYALLPNRNNIVSPPPNGSWTLPARSFGILRNVLSLLGASNTGAVLLVGVDAAKSTGTLKTISAGAYTWTPGPNGGKYGANIHGIGSLYLSSLYDGWCVGAEVSDTARTNIGVFNVSSTANLTVTAKIYSGPGLPVATHAFIVPPASYVQGTVGDWAPFVSDGVIWFDGASGSYAAYMSVNDNLTNDSNFQLATGW